MRLRPLLLLVLLPALVIASIGTLPVRAESSVLLQRNFGGAAFDRAYASAVDAAGNIYLTGETNSFGYSSSRLLLVKYNSTGSLQWARSWGSASGEAGLGIALGPSGVIYVTGFTYGFGGGNGDLLLLKYASNGSLIWQRTWGGSLYEFGQGVAVDTSGNVYVAGGTFSYGAGGEDVVVLKFSSDGSLLWKHTWGGSENDYGWSIAADNSGGIYVSGITPSIGAGAADAILLKFNATTGVTIFQETWGGADSEYGEGLVVDSSTRSVYMTGLTAFGAGVFDAFVLKASVDGALIWDRTWGGADYDDGRGIALDAAGQVYVSGFTHFGAGFEDMFLLKLTSGGGLALQSTFGGDGTDQAYSVAVDSSGNAYVAGYVGEAPPYSLDSGNDTLGVPGFSLVDHFLDILTPSATQQVPSGEVGSPVGSPSYVGADDLFFFKYGTVPSVTCGGGGTCTILSNATIISTSYDAPINTIHVLLAGDHGTTAWVNVTVPKTTVEDQDPSNIHVTVEGSPLPDSTLTITSNSTHFFIQFEFTFSSPDQADISLGTIVVSIPPYFAIVAALLMIPVYIASRLRRPSTR